VLVVRPSFRGKDRADESNDDDRAGNDAVPEIDACRSRDGRDVKVRPNENEFGRDYAEEHED